MKRLIPLIIILVLVLALIAVLAYCIMREPSPDVSEPHNTAEPSAFQGDIGNDNPEQGRHEQLPAGNPDESPPAGSPDEPPPAGNPDNLTSAGDQNGINVMLGTWHVDAISTIGEVSLHDTTMTFDETNRWSVDGTVTVSIPGVLSISEGLHGTGTYSYDPADSMIVFHNETYDSKEICHVEIIDENTLLITVREYIGDGELLYDVYTLTRA